MKIMIRAHDLGVKGEENIKRALRHHGLDGIQFVVYKSLDDVAQRPGAITRERAIEAGKTLHGVDIGLIGAYFNPVHPNREKAALGEAIFRDYLAVARELGSTTVGSETGSYMGDPWGYDERNLTDEALALAADSFRRLCDEGARHGSYVGIEGAYNHVASTPERLAELVSLIDRSNIRIIVDLYNYLNKDNYTEYLDILDRCISLFGDSILLYHLKDFVPTEDGLTQCALGQGFMDYEAILRRIKAQNPDAILVMEGTAGDDIPPSTQYLKQIISAI